MKSFEQNLSFYIELFDTERTLYKNGKKWAKKGWLTKHEFLSICLWKSRRPKNRYSKNSTAKIKQITSLAFKERDESVKMEILTRLKGVSIPTASALLSVTNPKKYPVIDKRCVTSLKDLHLIEWETITLASWTKYLYTIRDIAKRQNKSARDIEKALFAYNRLKFDRDLRNLYK